MTCTEPPRHASIRSAQHDELSWRVFGALHRVMQSQRRFMTQVMADREIMPAQALCMRVLGHHDGVTQRDLAELLEVSRPTVTVMVQRLEKSGLVERRVDETDQRFTRIYLTEAGWTAHEEMHGVLNDFIERAIGSLADEDQRELDRLLNLLNDNLSDSGRTGTTDRTEKEAPA
jgi:DNA-binding MarR family transcriptional regulator